MDNIIAGSQLLFTFSNLIFLNIGLIIGIIFGATPGLTANVAILMLLPLTFGMETTNVLILFLSIYCAGTYGGSISAILIGTPGTNAAAATMIDGYKLTKKGQAGKALQMALLASTIGGVVSALTLLLFAPIVAQFTIKFGPPEYFALAIFGLSIIAGIAGNNIFKGLIAGSFGVLISIVGLDPTTGISRFTFGSMRMMLGFGLLPVLLGAFALTNVLDKVRTKEYLKTSNHEMKITANQKLERSEIRKVMKTIFRSTGIGLFIGAIPGAGAAIASFIAYNEARRTSKQGKNFGTGILEGVAAPEAANNAVTATSLIPLLTLGIPGGIVAATLLGALNMHGINPGPLMFRDHGDLVYAIMIGMIFINIFMYLHGKFLTPYLVKITNTPPIMLVTGLIVLCTAGAFSVNNSMFDVYVLMGFGLVFYLLSKIDFPAVPVVLGLIMGPIAEVNLKRSLVMSDGRFDIFLKRPISLFFLIITILFLWILIRQNNKMKEESMNADKLTPSKSESI